MKKLKLKMLQFESKDMLTRTQLRNILGGDGSGPGGSQTCIARCPDGTTRNCYGSMYGGCIATDDVGCAGYDDYGVPLFNRC